MKNMQNKMKKKIWLLNFFTTWQKKRTFWDTPTLRSHSVGALTL
jgi:hypothetical protein